MLVFGIESSCDETSAGVLRDGRHVLSHVVSTQIKAHQVYGGVVPEMASRLHVHHLVPVLEAARENAGIAWADIDALAFAEGPGLMGSLGVGVAAAKAMSAYLSVPMIGVNHIEGHIYSNLLEQVDDFRYPVLVLVASGGHTQLILMREPFSYELLGNTLDDAIGEAFDKSARTLGLGYPGGPIIDDYAKRGNAKTHKFPHVRTERDLDFSFSGLKTAVLRYNQELGISELPKDDSRVADFCASLQDKLISELTKKTFIAAERYNVKQIVIAGGVSANSTLREQIKLAPSGILVSMPPLKYCTDNGVMIAAAGTARLLAGQTTSLDVVPNPSLRLVGQGVTPPS